MSCHVYFTTIDKGKRGKERKENEEEKKGGKEEGGRKRNETNAPLVSNAYFPDGNGSMSSLCNLSF